MAGQAGYRASVFVSQFNGNLVLVRAHRFAIDWKVDDFDTTSFINWGVGQYTGGITDFDISMDCFWFATDNPHHRNLGACIVPGATVQIRIRFAPRIALETPNTAPDANVDSPGYFFRRALITHMHTETAVRDVIRFNFAARVGVENVADLNALTAPLGSVDNVIGSGAIGHARVPE